MTQSSMLLGDLRQAREEGLCGDRWGMAYSLGAARLVLNTMAAAEGLRPPYRPPRFGRLSQGPLPSDLSAPLDQRLDVDSPLPGGRRERIARLDEPAGSVPQEPVAHAIGRALAALGTHPPAVGAALLATNGALERVRWDKGLEPEDWAAARDQVFEAYALALDNRPQARTRLAGANKALTALSAGRVYARRLTRLRAAPVLDLAALSALVHDLDVKVQALRDAAERARYGVASRGPDGAGTALDYRGPGVGLQFADGKAKPVSRRPDTPIAMEPLPDDAAR